MGGKPPAVPTVLPATFYTPFSRYYSQPRVYRNVPRRRPSGFSYASYPHGHYDGLSRTVHFFSK